jgi:hypothetical protein
MRSINPDFSMDQFANLLIKAAPDDVKQRLLAIRWRKFVASPPDIMGSDEIATCRTNGQRAEGMAQVRSGDELGYAVTT